MAGIARRVETALCFLFNQDARPRVRELLRCYRSPEASRVQLAVLVLSGGDVDLVAEFIQAANEDYRDVLLWAEYQGIPEQSRTFATRYKQLRKLQQANP